MKTSNLIIPSIGLTIDQRIVYETLIQKGPSPARIITKNTGIKRQTVYKILDELISLSLVIKDETSKVTRFCPEHPSKLKEILKKEEEKLKQSRFLLDSSLGNLISQFNAFSGKPNVQYHEGEEALHYLFEDILNENCDLLLFRSFKDNQTEATRKFLEEKIRENTKNNIHTRAITPVTDYLKEAVKTDQERLTERRVIPSELFSLPSQITIYGNKVSFISYEDPMFSIIIESPAVSSSFRVLFEYIWSTAMTPENYFKTLK